MIVTARTIRQAVETSLQTNIGPYLTAIAAQTGAEPLPTIRSWRRIADFVQLAEQDSPAVVITVGGLDGVPEPQEGGGHRAGWLTRVFVVARGRTYDETADRVGDYTAALRAALLTDPTLSGLTEQVVWRGESYTELDRNQQRTIAAGSVTVAYTAATDLGADSYPIVEVTGDYALLPVHPAL